MPQTTTVPDWAYVDKPVMKGVIKASPDDFRVEEVLGFDLSGSGEHLYLLLEKRSMNTLDVVKVLSKQFKLDPGRISYSGLKDKQAITRQWISLHSSKKISISDFESQELTLPGFRVLSAQRHNSKLKRGAHRANQFEIVIRNLSTPEGLDSALERVQRQGVPNYFGEQRFGKRGGNIEKARALFAGKGKVERQLRGIYLSAARSFLFNQVLSARVLQRSWALGLPGEVFMLDGSNSFFKTDVPDQNLDKRLDAFDIHPSAPLWGKGALKTTEDAAELEVEIVSDYADFTTGLEAFGLRQQRRATRLIPQGLTFSQLDDTSMQINFLLSKGNFATTVLRELITMEG
jgi:tRNA pseudouridine13 synthase